MLYNGNVLYKENVFIEGGLKPENGSKYRIYDSQGQFCAVYVYNGKHKIFKNEKMFV